MKIIEVTAPEGYEVEETTWAKDMVYDIVQAVFDDLGVNEGDPYADAIEVSDRIVDTLIAAGWRPTEED